VVVEVVSHLRIICNLPLPVCRVLLLHEAADYQACVGHIVLWLHASCLLCVLRAHRNNWFLCLLLVHEVDLLIFEDRLGLIASTAQGWNCLKLLYGYCEMALIFQFILFS
jgi:hypothetical protein